MMKKNIVSLVCLSAVLSIVACSQKVKTVGLSQSITTASGLSIQPFEETNDFPKAKLMLTQVKTEAVGTDSVKVTFNYAVDNYELTKQTADMHAAHAANSAEGQHIHFILDNKPYQALYKPTNTVTLAKNSEHYLLSFLSRSYHLSVKSPGASVLVKFKIDGNGNYKLDETPTEPMLFYSRPKGDYKGKDTEMVLLDFYVKNAKISPNDYQVKVSVNDNSFLVNTWCPYFIKGAAAGPMKIKIELLDKAGNTVNTKFNPTERTVVLKP